MLMRLLNFISSVMCVHNYQTFSEHRYFYFSDKKIKTIKVQQCERGGRKRKASIIAYWLNAFLHKESCGRDFC
jgi:hypothetical protein